MIIDLTDPFTATIIGGLIVAAILGLIHYSRKLVELNITNKKLSDVLSELYSLQQKHKEEISKINENSQKTFQAIFQTYDKEITKILDEHYDPLLQALKPVIKQNK